MSLIKIKYTEIEDNLIISVIDCHNDVMQYLKIKSYFQNNIDGVVWTIRRNSSMFFQHAFNDVTGRLSSTPVLYLSSDPKFNSVLVICVDGFTQERYINGINQTLDKMVKEIKLIIRS